MVPIRYTLVPSNSSVKPEPEFAHLLVPPIKLEPVSSVQLPSKEKLSSVISMTSMPSGAALVSSKPSLALYTPTSLIIGTFPSDVETVILTWSPFTADDLTSLLAPIVSPLSSSSHSPSSFRYSTLYSLILWPFWIASSMDTTSKVLVPPRSISRVPVFVPSSVVQ